MCQLVKADLCLTGNFGGGVQSFFVLLRFLVLLNLFSFLLIAGFVLIPSIVFSSEGIDFTNLTGNILAVKPISLPLDSGVGGHVTVGLYVFSSCPHVNMSDMLCVSRQHAVHTVVVLCLYCGSES